MNEQYFRINSRYKKSLVFHVGSGSGFFSEYFGMILAIAYCSIHRIKFVLFSKNANFGFNKGWTDFFEPFCVEVSDDFHSKLNRRQKFPSLMLILKDFLKKLIFKNEFPIWTLDKFKLYMVKQYIQEPFYKKKYHFSYYTFELWSEFNRLNPYKNYKILNENVITDFYEGNLKGLLKKIAINTWVFNEEIAKEIDIITRKLELPANYIGMHIRKGDKVQENKVYRYDQYFEVLKLNTANKNKSIFIFTDDFTVIEQARTSFPEFNYYYLCDKDEKGYNNVIFNNRDIEFKRIKLVNLFASIQILIRSVAYIGVYNSSPDMFIDLLRDNNTFWVDQAESFN